MSFVLIRIGHIPEKRSRNCARPKGLRVLASPAKKATSRDSLVLTSSRTLTSNGDTSNTDLVTCLTSTGIENWRSSKFNSRLPQPNAPQNIRPTILHSLRRVGRHEPTRVSKTRPANATRVQRTRQVLSLSQVLSLRHPRTISNIRPSTLLYISLRFLLKQHFQTTPDATRLTTPKDSSCKSLTTPEDSSCKPNIQSKNPHRYPRSPTWTDLRHQRVVLCPSEELLYKYTDRDVSIYHRDPEGSVKRQIFTLNPNKSGQRFRSLQSQVRTEYVEHPEWSLVNTYPAHIHTDPAGTITLQDFQGHCLYFTFCQISGPFMPCGCSSRLDRSRGS